jgi:adenosylmethionine-8-amino-7-oxononanoate aminotransferase
MPKIWRPYTQMATATDPLLLERAEGAYLYAKDGRKIFDGISSWWVITHGHCHPKVVEAIQSQAKKIDQVIFANFSHDPAEILVEELQKFLPHDLNRFFFSDNGSTSVEVAMKMAYQACQQSGKKEKTKFLAFEKSYHGDTCGVMSVSGDSAFTLPYGKMRFEVLRARQGQFSFDSVASYTTHLRELLERHHQELAAVLLEPLIQGAAGMIVWPENAVREVVKLCRDYGVYIIFDEVMTGFGRSGKMFAFEAADVRPDFLCLSKGLTAGSLPLALTITTEAVYGAFLSKDAEKLFFHGHSFTANPIACAAAVANLQIFREENVLAKIAALEEVHHSSLEKWRQRLPVKDIRIRGPVGALELNGEGAYGNSLMQGLTKALLQENIFIRPLGNVVYLLPPYCTKPAELSQIWDQIGESLQCLD